MLIKRSRVFLHRQKADGPLFSTGIRTAHTYPPNPLWHHARERASPFTKPERYGLIYREQQVTNISYITQKILILHECCYILKILNWLY